MSVMYIYNVVVLYSFCTVCNLFNLLFIIWVLFNKTSCFKFSLLVLCFLRIDPRGSTCICKFQDKMWKCNSSILSHVKEKRIRMLSEKALNLQTGTLRSQTSKCKVPGTVNIRIMVLKHIVKLFACRELNHSK